MTGVFKRGLIWLACLAPLFYLSYGLANYLASIRSHVPSLFFEWERSIPFIAWTIFPYWTINAFYGLSLIIARDKHELDRHGGRLLVVQIIAVTFFVLMPLKFSFGQPPVDGAPAFLFNALRGFDQSFNQAPSLHIALAVILWDFYQQRIRGWFARSILHVWTLLICVSVLTTFQHHFIDIPTGALAGMICLWLLPFGNLPNLLGQWQWTTNPQRKKLAAYYFTAAVLLAVVAVAIGGLALVLWWGTTALAIVALNYAGLGAQGFQKANGSATSWASQWLLWPHRFGAQINAWAWTRNVPAQSEVIPDLWVGRLQTTPILGRATLNANAYVLDLTSEFTSANGHSATDNYQSYPTLDLVVFDSIQFKEAAAKLDILWANKSSNPNTLVMVCCALGFSRSAALVAFWLVSRKHVASLDEAIAQVRKARPQVVINEAWLEAIRAANAK